MTKTENTKVAVDADFEERVKTFEELVSGMADLDPKLRHLWCEIYQNAIMDRSYSRLPYEDLIQKVLATPENHGLYGDKLAKYLERMSKANDQLLLLAKYIAEHQTTGSDISPDDLYSKFSK